VRIEALRAHPFAVPYASRYATARGESAVRCGVVVTLSTDAGIVGLGEASPYPGPGEREAQREVIGVLRGLAPALEGCDAGEVRGALDRALVAIDAGPSVARAVRAGVDIALWDACGRSAGVPIADLLSAQARRCVPVNALVGDPTVEGARARAREAIAAGFRAVKLKVGMARSVEEECARVAAVREAVGPGCALRLDANGAWGVERAAAVLRAVRPYGIEYVEQPVPSEDIDGMRTLRRTAGVRVAADEAVTDAAAARRLLEAQAADVLVVKPAVVGGLGAAMDIVRVAAEAGVPATVTTAIDSGVGVAAALHLAAALPDGSPACGLATAQLLASDLSIGLPGAEDGIMRLPGGAGLGVEVDPFALERYGGDLEE
jgi:o-succinylbenzoate synthase